MVFTGRSDIKLKTKKEKRMNKSDIKIGKKKRKNLESTIEDNIIKLMDKDGLVRKKARKKLVEIGTPAIDYLSEIETHPKNIARWEAVKTLSEIKDPIAAPLLINALEDRSEDVRWIAAEGLAALEDAGLKAILETLLSHERTLYLRKGAHHILTKLKSSMDKPIITELLHILDAPDAELKIPLKIMTYLDDASKNDSRE
jgi:HEAT repeat protein